MVEWLQRQHYGALGARAPAELRRSKKELKEKQKKFKFKIFRICGVTTTSEYFYSISFLENPNFMRAPSARSYFLPL